MATRRKNKKNEEGPQLTGPQGNRSITFKDFDIDSFNPDTEEWEYWFPRFKFAIGACGIEDDDQKRNYLLAKMSSKPFHVLIDCFHPQELEEVPYDDLLDELKRSFGRKDVSLCERLKFNQLRRVDAETVAEFVARLRAQATRCQFGQGLKEHLRDQLLFGINQPDWQQEILRKYPSVKSPFEDVQAMAQLLENAKLQQENMHARSATAHRIKPGEPTGSGSSQSTPILILTRGVDCFKCGERLHKQPTECLAVGKRCPICKKMNHLPKVCLNSGRVKIKRKDGRANNLRDDSEFDSGEETHVDLIRKIETGCEAYVTVKINGVPVEMLYDSGASKSVISEVIWRKIGAPKLKRTPSLVAYTGLKVKTLGEAEVQVEGFDRMETVPVVVTSAADVPLFGMNWALRFKLPLPEGAQVRNTKQMAVTKGRDWKTETLQTWLKEFNGVFKEGTGTIRNHKAVVHLKEDAKPKVFKPRRVPFALVKPVEEELQRLVAADVIEEVDPTRTPIEWASPLVIAVKANGKLRLCADFKVTINQCIHTDHHPIPTFEELATKLNGGRYFTVIDLRDAYLQMEVAEDSRKYLVIATHKGFYRYKRLPFGVSFAPGLFQRAIEHVLAGLPGVANYLDDIVITGETEEEHITRVRQVLMRLQAAGMRTQWEKCKWFQEEVTYLGHRIDKDGIRPTTDHLEAISNMPSPQSTKDLRAFLGAVNYYSRFVPNLQTVCAPLHFLLKKGIRWRWTAAESEVVERVKSMLLSSEYLAHYDPALPLVLTTDASDIGVGAQISHILPGGTERPICFASRKLLAAEQKYSAIDKETLGIMFGLQKFRQYLYGRHFIIRTDHKPLIHLLGEKNEIPKLAANRLTRWALTLSAFDYEIEHSPGKDNPADALSRLPLSNIEASDVEIEGVQYGSRLLHIRLDDLALSSNLLRRRLQEDPVISKVVHFVKYGWASSKEAVPSELHTFYEKRHELSVEEKILLWQGRLVIPSILRKAVLEVLHDGHPGMTGMKAVARSHVWWPNIDKDIDQHVRLCKPCQENRPREPEVPLYSWTVPAIPWSRIHIDFCGPFQKKYWLVLVDATTKWLEIFPMDRITTAKTICLLRDVFSRCGIPRVIVSDNGPQFTGSEFQIFCEDNNIRHVTSSPYHPKTNGLAEREVRTFKQRMKALGEVKDPNLRLQKFLFSYRTSPQKTTGRSPAELFYGRAINTRLDLLKPSVEVNVDVGLVKQKLYHDRSARGRTFNAGEAVWLQKPREAGQEPGTVRRRTGLWSYEVDVDGVVKRKHADQLRRRSMMEGGKCGDST